MANPNATPDRLASSRRFRAPLAAVGAAVLSLSMLLSVAPALGAANTGNGGGNSSAPAGNGTSGNVKVHDAGTGVETSGTDNEPHVCSFWLGFTFDAPFEAGTWVVVSWAPTGDGSIVASGVYDTAGDGVDSSSVIEVAAGHYRVEWAATGATSSKKKTFWVDASCEAPGSPAEEESQAEEPVPATDDPGSPAEEESQAEEPVPATDDPGSPAEEESQAEEAVTEEETAPSDEPLVEDVAAPMDVANDEKPAQAVDPGSIETGTPPDQEELGATGSPDEPTMSDTAVPAVPVESGLPATIGLLVLVVLHASLRRDRRADRDNGAPAA
jgi:hypothetical protein